MRDVIAILVKTSSMLWIAPVFAGDAALILVLAPRILQPRGNCSSTYGPPLGTLLLVQWKGLVV